MGNFFILRANVPKMFTDNSAKLHNVHSVNSRVALIRKCRTTEFWWYYVLNCEFVWTTRVLLSLPGNILTGVRTAARNVVFICLFVCVCVFWLTKCATALTSVWSVWCGDSRRQVYVVTHWVCHNCDHATPDRFYNLFLY